MRKYIHRAEASDKAVAVASSSTVRAICGRTVKPLTDPYPDLPPCPVCRAVEAAEKKAVLDRQTYRLVAWTWSRAS